MPARITQNSGGNNYPKKAQKAQTSSAIPADLQKEDIASEMQAVLSNNANPVSFSNVERAEFYGGRERLDLQGNSVQRVRELQEENDHLQREIAAKETQISECTDPLTLLADIEHRKIMIARNTGEILKIYLGNEERMKRIKELESHNSRIQNEMMEMQGRFITTKDMEEKTKFASEFFVLRSEIERNLQEIGELNQN